MASFRVRPTSILTPNFESERRFITPFWISGTSRLSKSGVYVWRLVKKGACGEIGACGSKRFSSRSGTMRTTAFRSGEGEERIQVFEQERLVGGEGELRVMGGGMEAALNQLSKWLVAAIFSAIIIWKHDGEAMWLLTGSVLNTMLAKVLKRILNQDRPVSALKSDPGMPSSHAQSIFFAAVYVIFSLINWLEGVNVLSLVLSSLVLAVGSYLSWLRVSQHFHTVGQVVVGGIVGSAFSFLWIWSWDAVLQDAYISQLWVRVFVALGAVGFSIAFVTYVVRHWLNDDA